MAPWPRLMDCLEPDGFGTSPLHYSWPSQALPRPPPSALHSQPPRRLTSGVGGGAECPSHGTLCPCHPHPSPTNSHVNGCVGLHACHLQSVLSGWRDLVKDLSQIMPHPCSKPSHGSHLTQVKARVLTQTREVLPPSGT